MRANRGFTLVELVVVLILIGILALGATPYLSPGTLTLGAQADQLANDIRYVQALSMTQGARYCINISATGYAFERSNPPAVCDQAVPHPGTGSTAPIAFGTGITSTTPGTIAFDGLGRPWDPSALQTTTRTVSLSGPGTSPRTIQVIADTGAVIVP